MADTLEPPVRYPRDNEQPSGRRKKPERRKRERKSSTVIKPERSFGKSRISDFFVTGGFDIPFFALTMVILAIGLVMLFSSSYAYSYYKYDNSYHYFFRQLIFAAVGIALMLFISKFNYRWFKALAPILFGVTLFLLILVLFYHTNVATDEGEAFRRYIKIPIPGISLTFQPSDIAKFTLVITLAAYISNHASKMNKLKEGFFIPFAIVMVFVGLVGLENHLSGMILLFTIGVSVMFAGGSNKTMFIIGIAAVAAVVILVFARPDIMPNYVQEKMTAWLDKDFEPLGARWQTNNSLYAIGSGGFFGAGLGNSKQKYMYVSEPQNDFIFSIICEELGFFGAAVIICLFAALVVRGIIIALRCDDRFASLTVIGIVTQIGAQVAFNILVVTDSIPNTGIALPFFSYGGTALVMLLVEMGVVLGISRKSNQKKV